MLRIHYGSDVNQINNMFWENMEFEVGRIVWDSITRLGISCIKEKCDSVKDIRLMDNKDKEEKEKM